MTALPITNTGAAIGLIWQSAARRIAGMRQTLHDIGFALGAIAIVAIKAAALVACGAGMVGGLVTAAIWMGVTR